MFFVYLLVWIIALIPGALIIWVFIAFVKDKHSGTFIDKYFK